MSGGSLGKKHLTIAGAGVAQTKCKCDTSQRSKVVILNTKAAVDGERKRQQDVSRFSSDLLRLGVIALCALMNGRLCAADEPSAVLRE